ncbi:MAG: ubiquinol-cytochrome c reductase iron-sulfur subunit [Nitrospirota bacterium]|nr:ubiquinol-cytochrome c reductase iron-sulfur subunit [Nitrospirota bacterium]
MEDGLSTPVGTRRSFFVKTTVLISSLIGFSLAVPLIGYVVDPALRRRTKEWVSLGKTDKLPVGEPQSLDHRVTVKDGWQKSQTTKGVWALKQADGQVTVYSPICPHLGCGFRWDQQDRLFKCPCHGSIFNIDGTVKAGPAPRPLDILPSKIENGDLLVQYQEFKSGLAKKVEL